MTYCSMQTEQIPRNSKIKVQDGGRNSSRNTCGKPDKETADN